jgi:hypothetical protein
MPCHAMHPIQDLFLESFSYVLQFDMYFYMHSYVGKNLILVKSGCYKAVGGEQMDIEGNQQMDMDNDDDEHETETDGAEMSDTGDSIVSGSWHRSRRKSHDIMPPLVLDSKDGKIVIKPTGDG